MAKFSNARFATVLAVVLALFVSGAVAGAVGGAVIIGAANDAQTSNTSLDTTSSGFAWQMYQHGSGVGIFGISDNGVALAGLAHNGSQHALSVTNDGSAGTGAALIADGRNNTAADLRVNSNSIPPLKVNSTAKVTNLNADSLDGIDSERFLPGGNLPANRTIRGVFLVGGTAAATGNIFFGDISYGWTLGGAPVEHYIQSGGVAPAECTGTVSAPTAAAGHLCVYEEAAFTAGIRTTSALASGRYGTRIYVISSGSGQTEIRGSWAVTTTTPVLAPAPAKADTGPTGR